MTSPAPIALFAFNRPEHTAATLEALSKNGPARGSSLTVFCDGPRSEEDEAAVAETRRVAREASGFGEVVVVERPRNLGLAESVITGVTEILDRHQTVIVVEDDLITSPHFLGFLNEGLKQYAAEERVMSVCGYSYPSEKPLPETFLLPGAHPWGWATWKRAWALFERDPKALLARLVERDRIFEFDVQGSYPHTAYLLRAAEGQADSWALRWIGSVIVNDGLTLYPGRSLVHNAGMDGSGRHSGSISIYDTALAERPPRCERLAPEVDREALAQRAAFHVAWRGRWSLKERLYYAVARWLPERVEKAAYSAITRRTLRRVAEEIRRETE